MLRLSELRNHDGGSAMVDFALTSLIFLTVLLGIVDVARAAFAYSWVSDAARRGSRFAMVRGTNCSGLSGGCPAQATDVTTYLDGLATGIDTTRLNVTAQCFAGGTYVGLPPCAPTGYIKVKVQYSFKFLTALVPLSWNMQSTSERVVQN